MSDRSADGCESRSVAPRLAHAVACCVVALSTASGRADELERLEGDAVAASITAIRADGAVLGEGIPERLTLGDIRRYVRPIAKPAPGKTAANGAARAIVELIGGGRVVARAVTLADERLRIETLDERTWDLPIDLVAGVRFDVAAPLAPFTRALAKPAADVDRFLIRGEEPGSVEALDGLVESLAAESVRFELAGESREVPRERLYGFVLARPAGADTPRPRGWLALVDGGRLPFERLELEGDVVRASGAGDARFETAWSQVASFELHSERVEFLSDRKPSDVQQRTWVAPSRPWRTDASVGGRPITLAGRSFAKGLGVQAGTRLAYPLEGRFATLLAVVGLDAETDGAGDCVAVVLGDDGRELWRERIRGGDPPKPLRLDVRGVRSVTLVVEPGEDLDLSDHVDWADARLLKPPR